MSSMRPVAGLQDRLRVHVRYASICDMSASQVKLSSCMYDQARLLIF